MVCVLSLVGRILLAALFIAAGVDHVQNFDSVVADFNQHEIFSCDVLLEQELFVENREVIMQGLVGFALFLQIAGGLLVVLNCRIGYLMLIAFTVPVTYVHHAFWESATPEADMIHFMKNVALVGALLALFAAGCGASTCAAAPAPAAKKGKKQKRN